MKFVTYSEGNGAETVGVLTPDGAGVHALRDCGVECRNMLELIEKYDGKMAAALQGKITAPGRPLAGVTLAAPIPHPRHDLICVGQNYLAHAIESAKFSGVEFKKNEYPVYFAKRVNRAVPPEGDISAHADLTSKLDYEAELAVIIGRRCDHVRPEEVFNYVFGYTIVNDVSARDLQTNHKQFLFGKSLDNFTPMGPCIVTRDEVGSPPQLRVRTWLNGELRQDSNTSDFIYDIPFLVSQLSQGIVLEPGDILITGTPSGVGLGQNPPAFLKVGDRLEMEIEGIGRLRNRIG